MSEPEPAQPSALAPAVSGLEKFFARFSFRQLLAAIFCFALGLRIAVIFFLANFKTISGMENELLALNLLAGKGHSLSYIVNEMPSALVGPVYTFFLYLHFWIFGKNYLFVELTQALIGSGSAVMLALLGRRLAGERVGVFSGLAFAGYPLYVYWTALAFQLTIDVFLLELCLLLVLLAMERQKFLYQLLAGACIGLAALSKSFYLSFLFLYLLWYWLWQKPKFSRIIFTGCVWSLCAAAVISPWTIRNYRVFHQWVPLTTNGGPNLWYGNNPHATGSLYTRDGKKMLDMLPAELMKKIETAKSEAEKDRLMRDAAMDWIKSHPRQFLKLVPLRLRAIWWFDPEMATSFPLERKLVYLALLALAVPGMILSRKLWRKLAIFYLLPLWTTAFYSLFVGQARFRYLIEFGFLFFAGFFIHRLLSFLEQKLGLQTRS